MMHNDNNLIKNIPLNKLRVMLIQSVKTKPHIHNNTK